jgi:hypothetical protein
MGKIHKKKLKICISALSVLLRLVIYEEKSQSNEQYLRKSILYTEFICHTVSVGNITVSVVACADMIHFTGQKQIK